VKVAAFSATHTADKFQAAPFGRLEFVIPVAARGARR